MVDKEDFTEDEKEKIGAREIKAAYFKSWYEPQKELLNKKRREKRREEKKNRQKRNKR